MSTATQQPITTPASETGLQARQRQRSTRRGMAIMELYKVFELAFLPIGKDPNLVQVIADLLSAGALLNGLSDFDAIGTLRDALREYSRVQFSMSREQIREVSVLPIIAQAMGLRERALVSSALDALKGSQHRTSFTVAEIDGLQSRLGFEPHIEAERRTRG
jgi:hypothetical protein